MVFCCVVKIRLCLHEIATRTKMSLPWDVAHQEDQISIGNIAHAVCCMYRLPRVLRPSPKVIRLWVNSTSNTFPDFDMCHQREGVIIRGHHFFCIALGMRLLIDCPHANCPNARCTQKQFIPNKGNLEKIRMGCTLWSSLWQSVYLDQTRYLGSI